MRHAAALSGTSNRYGAYGAICKLALAVWLLLATPAMAKDIHIVALGDSLTAGYLLPPGQGFPEQLQKALIAKGIRDVVIENAGVSGDTSSGGLSRLDWAVGPQTDAVILELGANDALRGINPAITRANLDQIIRDLTSRKIPVLLVGMYAPPNLGKEYGEEFNAIYPELAKAHRLTLYPFFLEGVATNSDLSLADGMHPNERGIAVMVTRFMPFMEKFISEIRSSPNQPTSLGPSTWRQSK